MKSMMVFKRGNILVLLLVSALVHMVTAGDPDIVSDFIVSQGNSTAVNADFFTYTGFVAGLGNASALSFNVSKASLAELPSLNGQSVSMALLQFPGGTVNPPHTHPRSAELLFLIGEPSGNGSLEVGFVDTTNKLYTQTLRPGDMFVFPKGLVHYQYNPDPYNLVMALSAFGSANPGTVSVPRTLFTTGIDDTILAKSFKTDADTIDAIKAGMATKA